VQERRFDFERKEVGLGKLKVKGKGKKKRGIDEKEIGPKGKKEGKGRSQDDLAPSQSSAHQRKKNLGGGKKGGGQNETAKFEKGRGLWGARRGRLGRSGGGRKGGHYEPVVGFEGRKEKEAEEFDGVMTLQLGVFSRTISCSGKERRGGTFFMWNQQGKGEREENGSFSKPTY